MSHLLIALMLTAAPTRLAVMPLDAGEGVPEKTAAALTEAVVGEVRKRAGGSVLTPSEMNAVLSLERQKQLLGCNDESCAADLGNVLGVDRMLLGSVSNLGASWLLHLKLVDVRKVGVVAQADRRLKDKTIDDVLDAIGPAVGELFGAPGGTVVASAVAPDAEVGSGTVSSTGGVDEPADVAADVRKLTVLTDGQGHFIAVSRGAGSDSLFFAGDAKQLHAQRIIGYSADGDGSYRFTIWDPRVRDGWQRGFEAKDGGYALQCGDKSIAFKPASAADVKRVGQQAKLLKARWRRAAAVLARDDGGNYFLVDQPREEGGDPAEDLRLFFGPKGGARQLAIKSAVADDAGMLVVTATGRLKISPQKKEAEWITTAGTLKLTPVEIGPAEARMIYAQFGAYGGEKLGTACDPFL